jgi:glucosamine--fructose-6-phosphate aminotransferase (isomerizing)
MHAPGTQRLAEIYEQPTALAGLLEAEADFARAAEGIRERGSQLVRLVGHGSSDNAASYGIYSFGLLPKLTAIRDSITLTVYYGTELDMSGSTVIGLSQSGATPDVVDYVERARKAGAFTIGITNEEDSPLAKTAEVPLLLGAGKEKAIVATKTYMNQVASLGLLAAHVAGKGKEFSDSLPSR